MMLDQMIIYDPILVKQSIYNIKDTSAKGYRYIVALFGRRNKWTLLK